MMNEETPLPSVMPQHPLPAEILQMPKTETVCRYCGISYLIHNEIRLLEERLKAAERELEHLRKQPAREAELSQQLACCKNDLATSQNEHATCKLELNVAEAEIRKHSLTILSLEDNIESLKNQLNTYRLKENLVNNGMLLFKEKVKEVRNWLNSLRTETESALSAYRVQFESTSDSISTACTTSLAGITSQLDTAASQLRSLSMATERSNEDIRKLKAEIEQERVLRHQAVADSQTICDNYAKDLKAKEELVNQLQQELTNVRSNYTSQVQELRYSSQTEQKELLGKFEALEKARKESDEEAAKLKKEIETKTASHQEEIENLKLAMQESAKKAIEEASNLKTLQAVEVRDLELRLKEDFRSQLFKQEKAHQLLVENALKQAKDSETALKNQLDAVNNEAKLRLGQLHQHLDAEKTNFEQKELSLRMECDRLKEVVASLERDFDSAGKAVTDFQLKFENAVEEVKVKQSELQQLQLELAATKQSLESVLQENVFLNGTVRRECEERLELTEKLNDMKRELFSHKQTSNGTQAKKVLGPLVRRSSLRMVADGENGPQESSRGASSFGGRDLLPPLVPTSTRGREQFAAAAAAAAVNGSDFAAGGLKQAVSSLDYNARTAGSRQFASTVNNNGRPHSDKTGVNVARCSRDSLSFT